MAAGSLPEYGPAPDFAGISSWFNSRPLTIADLRGKVVLIDFWTYSCINCLRTLPHLEAWYRTYRRDGLVIVGVHTPEFAFESEPSNVRAATTRLGVKYPVALDPKYGTWNAYGNQYWPAEYLIDRSGQVRAAHFGEGKYDETEENIRVLLGMKQAAPVSDHLRDLTPSGLLTPESYLGYDRLDRYAGSPLHPDKVADYTFPAHLDLDGLAYAGRLRLEHQRIAAVSDARLRLRFHASKVFLVLGGTGTVQVLVDGKPERTVRVNADRLYTLVDRTDPETALLELRFSPGRRGLRVHVRLAVSSASARRTGRGRAPRPPRARAGSATARPRATRRTAGRSRPARRHAAPAPRRTRRSPRRSRSPR